MLSSGLSGIGFAQSTFIVGFLDILFSEGCSEFSRSDSSADFEDLLGELKSSNGDNLSLDSFSINQDSLVVEDVYDGGKLSFEGTVVNSSNSADLNKSVVTLC